MSKDEGRRKSEIRSAKFATPGSVFRIRASGFFRISAFVIRIWRRVRQFHHVIEAPCVVVLSHVQDGELAGMRPRNGFEALNAFELTLKRTFIVETAAGDHLHRAKFTKDTAREPDLAVAAPADAADDRVIGDRRREIGQTNTRSGSRWAGGGSGPCAR